MARRFSRWDYALRINDGEAKAGSALEEYKKYKTGEKTVKYTRAASSKPGEINITYVIAFGDKTATHKYQITVSKRAIDYTNNLLNNDGSVLNLQNFTEGTDKLFTDERFDPARAIISTVGTGVSPETSKITGEPYDKRTGKASYTLPFGSNGTKDYKEVASEVRKALVNPQFYLSFKPEVMPA